MLKVFTFQKVKHLISTRPGIIVTNACNLSCGGCNAQCGKFSKDKLWFISIDQFVENIEYIKNYMYQGTTTLINGESVEINPQRFPVDLIGGEPTVHPEWKKIWQIVTQEYKDIKFVISTNGRRNDEDAENVFYYRSYKTKEIGKQFVSTLVAPIDIVGNQNKKYYWDSAQIDCGIWFSTGCVNPIYKNYITFCSVASSWNDLLDLDINWPLTPGMNPFCKLTDLDVDRMASKVCYRCGWAKKVELPENQESQLYDLVSDTNLEVLQKNSVNKPYKIVYRDGDEIKVSDLKNSRTLQLVQLTGLKHGDSSNIVR